VAQQVLRDCRPDPGGDDPREFTWHHLWRESRRELAVLSERGEQVLSLALSGDGRTVATGDRDGTIRLRDARTGVPRLEFRGGRSPIGALAFSGDGRRLASGTGPEAGPTARGQGELLLWETASGRLLARLDGFDRSAIGDLRFDPSGELLWIRSGAPGGGTEIGLWELEAGARGARPRPLRRWGGGFGLSVSADGRRVAAYEDQERVVVVEEPLSGRVLRRLPRVPHGYRGAGLSRDGRLVATASADIPGAPLELTVREVDTGRLLLDRHGGPLGPYVAPLEFSADGRSLVALDHDGTMYHYALDTGATWANESDPRDERHSNGDASLLPGGRLLAWSYRGPLTGSRPLRIYDRADGTVRATFPGRPEPSDQMFGFADGRSLVFRSGTQAVAWHFETTADPQPAGHVDEAWAAGFSGDGRLLATGSDDTDEPSTLKLWDAATGRLLRGWKAHDATTAAVAIQPGGPVLASAGLLPTENLRLWDAATGALLATLGGHTDRVRTVAFEPDGRLLASAGSDRTIRLWDVSARRCIGTLAGHSDTVRQVAFSPDGRTLASASNDSTVRLWEVDRPEPVWTWKGGVKVAAVAFSADGRVLAWGHEDGVIQRLDLIEKRPLAAIQSEYDEVRCLCFSPDGRTLAAAGRLGRVHLWDAVSGDELLALEGRPCQVNALAFSPDGSSLAACWHDGVVRIVRSR
jgi:WD40 repeat protein